MVSVSLGRRGHGTHSEASVANLGILCRDVNANANHLQEDGLAGAHLQLIVIWTIVRT